MDLLRDAHTSRPSPDLKLRIAAPDYADGLGGSVVVRPKPQVVSAKRMMMWVTDDLYGVNVVTVASSVLLLATTSISDIVHLVRQSGPDVHGRGAVHDFYFERSDDHYALTRRNYERAALLDPCWSETTMCGRAWAAMVGGDGGPLSGFSQTAFAPTCKRCLSVIDREFPEPIAHAQLPLIVQLTADVVLEQGFAEVRDVPGDQQAALRKRVRELVRHRASVGCRTYVHGGLVIFSCEEIYDRHAEEHSRQAADAISAALLGHEPIESPAWRLSWSAWVTE